MKGRLWPLRLSRHFLEDFRALISEPLEKGIIQHNMKALRAMYLTTTNVVKKILRSNLILYHWLPSPLYAAPRASFRYSAFSLALAAPPPASPAAVFASLLMPLIWSRNDEGHHARGISNKLLRTLGYPPACLHRPERL